MTCGPACVMSEQKSSTGLGRRVNDVAALSSTASSRHRSALAAVMDALVIKAGTSVMSVATCASVIVVGVQLTVLYSYG